MGIKKYNPTTPGLRGMTVSTFEEITKTTPEKSLTVTLKKHSGRNNRGKITVRHKGGGYRPKYRIIDFKRNKHDIEATVKTVEYDPNRTAFIALVEYADGEKRYIIAPNGIKVDQKIMAGESVEPNIGNAMKLKNIPLGTVISCIEMKPGQGAILARSAGSSAQLTSRDGKYAIVKLPSGESRMILVECYAMIGSVSNGDHQLTVSGKAGRSRWLGRRPRTRPVVMNPVDHPMGGGEGRSSGGHPRSRNGKPSKGYKTRKKNKVSNRYIVSKRK